MGQFQSHQELAMMFTDIRYALIRSKKRVMRRLIDWMIPRCGWMNNVLDTNIPNVPCLKVVSLTVRNSYGQEHVIR